MSSLKLCCQMPCLHLTQTDHTPIHPPRQTTHQPTHTHARLARRTRQHGPTQTPSPPGVTKTRQQRPAGSVQITQCDPYVGALLHVAHTTVRARAARLLGPRPRERLVGPRAAQPRPVPAVAPVRHGPAEQRAGAHVVDIVAVVLDAAEGDGGGAQQGQQAGQRAQQVAADELLGPLVGGVGGGGAVGKDAQLPGQKKRQVAEPGEGEGAVARGEAAPAVVQQLGARLGAGGDGDEGGPRRAGRGLAAREQVRPGPAGRVLGQVGQQRGQGQGDGQAEDRDVVLVRGGAGEAVDEKDEEQGQDKGVGDVEGCAAGQGGTGRGGGGGGRGDWSACFVLRARQLGRGLGWLGGVRTKGHALDLGVGKGNAQIVEGEHAVEGLDEELDLGSCVKRAAGRPRGGGYGLLRECRPSPRGRRPPSREHRLSDRQPRQPTCAGKDGSKVETDVPKPRDGACKPIGTVHDGVREAVNGQESPPSDGPEQCSMHFGSIPFFDDLEAVSQGASAKSIRVRPAFRPRWGRSGVAGSSLIGPLFSRTKHVFFCASQPGSFQCPWRDCMPIVSF